MQKKLNDTKLNAFYFVGVGKAILGNISIHESIVKFDEKDFFSGVR